MGEALHVGLKHNSRTELSSGPFSGCTEGGLFHWFQWISYDLRSVELASPVPSPLQTFSLNTFTTRPPARTSPAAARPASATAARTGTPAPPQDPDPTPHPTGSPKL